MDLITPFKCYSEGIPDPGYFGDLTEMPDNSNIAALWIQDDGHPIHIAKEAASLDKLSGGRFLLDPASGDRKKEYPACN